MIWRTQNGITMLTTLKRSQLQTFLARVFLRDARENLTALSETKHKSTLLPCACSANSGSLGIHLARTQLGGGGQAKSVQMRKRDFVQTSFASMCRLRSIEA